MASGYILIAAILILGGFIATVGDRLGSRVGKARLSLFNLRPRQTAVVITIFTGSLVSASTLGILLAIDGQLRTGVFELGNIQSNLQRAREELAEANAQKELITEALTKARRDQQVAQSRLDQTNASLNAAIRRQFRTQEQLLVVAGNFLTAQEQLKEVSAQAEKLRSEIQQLQAERQKLVEQQQEVQRQISQRDQEIRQRSELLRQRDQEIADRDQVITQRAARLKDLEEQQSSLERAVSILVAQYRNIREGNVRLFTGQVLATGIVRIVDPQSARQAVDQLLSAANRTAIQLTRPGVDDRGERVIQITNAEVEGLVNQIRDGRDYVVFVLSAANYLSGERNIKVVASAILNQLVFTSGTIVSSRDLNPNAMAEPQIRQEIETLLAAAEFRARSAGVLSEGLQASSGDLLTAISQFVEKLRQYNQTLDIQVVTAESVYTAGPLKVQLVALKNGQEVFRSG